MTHSPKSARRSTKGWRYYVNDGRPAMPERLIEERFDLLGEKVDRATDKLEADRVARIEAKQAEDEKAKWWRIAAVAGPIVGVIGIVLAAIALVALARFEAERVARSEVSCREDNKGRAALNDALLDASGFDVENGVWTDRFLAAPPEQQERVLAILDRRLRELRVCTTAGIEAYFAEDGGVVETEVPPLP